MSALRAVREVARWELVRYAKPKQHIVGFFMTAAILLGFTWFGRFGGEPAIIEVAVIGAEHLPTLPDRAGRFELRPRPMGHAARLRLDVERRDVDALLVLRPDGEGELLTRRSPGWRGELERELSMALALHRLQEAGLDPDILAAVQAPFRLEVRQTGPRTGRGAATTALIAIGLMLYGLFVGVAYIFASVTGEKQNRLSEQVVSAISAQAWIDGKIIGLAGVALVNIVTTLLAVGAWLAIRRAIWGDPIPVPPAVEQPVLLAIAIALIVLGFFFWFALITAVAAMVDDPHNSNRSQLVFLPLLSAVPAFLALTDVTAGWVRALSIAPPTSAAVMPVRMLVGDVAAWEVALAAALLAAVTLLARRAAGKVFRLAMLMYGKEPGWGEVRRWVREA